MILDPQIDLLVDSVREAMKNTLWKWYALVNLDGVEINDDESKVILDFSHLPGTVAHELRTGTGLTVRFTKSRGYLSTETDDTEQAIRILGRYQDREVARREGIYMKDPAFQWRVAHGLLKWVCHRDGQDSKDIKILREGPRYGNITESVRDKGEMGVRGLTFGTNERKTHGQSVHDLRCVSAFQPKVR
jgi:hypothetical protein